MRLCCWQKFTGKETGNQKHHQLSTKICKAPSIVPLTVLCSIPRAHVRWQNVPFDTESIVRTFCRTIFAVHHQLFHSCCTVQTHFFTRYTHTCNKQIIYKNGNQNKPNQTPCSTVTAQVSAKMVVSLLFKASCYYPFSTNLFPYFAPTGKK